MKISACIITKNEEQNISRCIHSFKDSVDEIIVVDTGSTDGTVKIAKKLGAKVYYFKWNNNFSDAKNFALKQAKGHWIIFLDADEYFYGETSRNIRLVLKIIHPNKDFDAVSCKLLNLGEDRDKILDTCNTVRIFRNDKQIRYQGHIHEQICKNGRLVETYPVSQDKFFICHTGYASETILKEKGRRNLELLLNDLSNGRDTPLTHAYLAITYFASKDYEKVIIHARKFIDSGSKDFDQIVKVHLNLALAMVETGHPFKEVYQVIERALADFPEHPDLHYTLGQLLLNEKKYSDALKAFEETLSFGFKYCNTIQTASWPSYLSILFSAIGFIHDLKNDSLEAEKYYIKSLGQDKQNIQNCVRLLNIMKGRNPEKFEIITVLKTLYNDKSPQEIQILVNLLAQLRERELLSYYCNIWKNNFGRVPDSIQVLVLFVNAKYEEAFKYFNDFYVNGKNEAVALYAVVSALLSKNQVLISEIKHNVNLSLRNLIDCYTGTTDDICLRDGDIDHFVFLLREFTLLEGGKHIHSWLELKTKFDRDISFELGEFLFNTANFESALEQFCDALNNDYPNKGELFFKIAFCSYKIFKYKKAAEFVEKAVEEGYQNNEVSELIQWINEKSKKLHTSTENKTKLA